jgi:biopolymer transport protein ExbD
MSFLPEEQLKSSAVLNLAPMIDFLFLLLMFFATLAVTRNTTKDTKVELVEITPEASGAAVGGEQETYAIQMNVLPDGHYEWVTGFQNHPFDDSEAIALELKQQYETGILPQSKEQTKIFLKIDKKASWEPILKLLFAIRDAGFEAHPVYEPLTR